MRIIEEMVEYFSELLTEEQKAAVEKLFSIPSPEDDDYDEYYEDYEDDSGYDDEDFLLDFDPYDQDVLFPPQLSVGANDLSPLPFTVSATASYMLLALCFLTMLCFSEKKAGKNAEDVLYWGK